MCTDPINIDPKLKRFLTFMKLKLKQRSDSFFSDSKTLLYYLQSSKKFEEDYAKYLKIQEMMT